MKRIEKFALIVMVGLLNLTVACTNINQKISSLNTASGTTLVVNSAPGSYSHTLKAFTEVGNPSNSSLITMSLTTDTSSVNYQPLTGFCGLNGTNPCNCSMSWTQINTVNGTAYNYSRTKQVPVSVVQTGLISCYLDQTVWAEIPDATVISFQVIAGTGNATGIHSTILNWKKGTSVSVGADFLDDTLTPFHNIHRYTCFSKSVAPRAYEITSQFTTATANSTSYNITMGSQYCANPTGTSTCPKPRSGYTAQSYYRNFFIRSDQFGQINSTNDTYDCPKVLESIKYSAGQSIPASETKYFPLDTTFALATTPTSDWSVGVSATTILYKDGDSNSQQTYCVGEATPTPTPTPTGTTITTAPATGRLVDKKVAVKCLGYARKPTTTGTCGTLKDSNGRVRPLTRLRRFRVIYPPMFDSTGAVITTNTFADEIFVADRLAVDSTGNATGNMIYGPKPCNFAWFDHEGVTKRDGTTNFYSNLRGDIIAGPTQLYATPGYRATSDYQYREFRDQPAPTPANPNVWSVDPDGIVLPNIDHAGTTTNANNYSSCSATVPWIDWINGVPTDLRLVTTNTNRVDTLTLGSRTISLREIHNQTVDPWTPNYVEDTSFNACVPMPSTQVEPPLHFYKQDNNTMSWCADVYPTQNPYWYDLNKYRKPQNGSAALSANVANYPSAIAPNNLAQVQIYTSHDITGSSSTALDAEFNGNCLGTQASQICSMTGFLTGSDVTYCNQFLKRTNAATTINTCDRTVSYDPNQAFLDFPLLAKDDDINKMLSSDLAHDKSFSCQYSVNSDATKVGTKIPSSGCCGYIGAPSHALLHNLTNGNGAHLEPYKDPAATTDVRFCGWPVE